MSRESPESPLLGAKASRVPSPTPASDIELCLMKSSGALCVNIPVLPDSRSRMFGNMWAHIAGKRFGFYTKGPVFQLLRVQAASSQGDGGMGIVRRIRDELHVGENPAPTKPGPFVGDLPAAIFFLSNLSGFCEEA